MLGFEFLALINVLIYVGALAVLFLFVIMLIEVPTTELRAYYRGSSVLGLLSNVGVIGMFNMRHDYSTMTLYPTQESIMQIGYAFYVQYADILILNSLVLTIALFGALVLAHTRS
jgi:NADH:ubiquinone oxidoreductase subunit 6 (subunit J)